MTIDEQGQGRFNALPLFYRLQSVIDGAFAPTSAETRQYADQNYLTLHEAKLALEKLSKADRDRCHQHAVSELHRQFEKDFGPTMEIELRKLAESVALRALRELRPQLRSGLTKKAEDARRKLRTIDRWRLGRRGPGRRAGSKLRKNSSGSLQRQREHKQKILASMKKLFGNGADPETRKAVAEDLGIDRKTLNNWLREGGWDFEDLLAQCVRNE